MTEHGLFVFHFVQIFSVSYLPTKMYDVNAKLSDIHNGTEGLESFLWDVAPPCGFPEDFMVVNKHLVYWIDISLL